MCSVNLPHPEAQLTGDVLNGCSRRVSDHTPAGTRSRARLATKSSGIFGCQFVAERGELGAEPRLLDAWEDYLVQFGSHELLRRNTRRDTNARREHRSERVAPTLEFAEPTTSVGFHQ